MKIYLIPILSTLIIFSACNREAEQQMAAYMLDSINSVVNTKDSTINDLLSSFSEIQANLDSVAIMQGIISTEIKEGKNELSGNAKSLINSQIAAINDLMVQNRKKIEGLNRNLKRSSLKINQLEKMITGLNESIAQKTRNFNLLTKC